MSLTASMWTSVSGLLVHGEKMNVIGNNISNVNTVGFKASRMDFQDFVCQGIGTAAGIGQVGRGTSIGIIMNDFSQGSFETTTETTDIAIAGNGFFSVKPLNSNMSFYTRAGNFRFNKDGYLVDPHGYAVQGWQIDNSAASLAASTGTSSSASSAIKGTGVPTDVRLDTFSCPPRHTSNMTIAVNLDSAPGNDNSVNEDWPFFSLLNIWDATPNSDGEINPIGSQAFAHAQTIEVFDEGGRAHKLTIYFDRVEQTADTNIDNMLNNEIVWEYIVTMEPSDDVRNFSNPADTAGEVPAEYKGLLMSGTMVFGSNGQLKDQTAYVPTSADMGDFNTWVQAPISSNGYPVLCPNFSGREGASSAWNDTQTLINREADGYLIELNMGLRSKSSTWGGNAPATIAGWTQGLGTDKIVRAPSGTAAGTILTGYQEPYGTNVQAVVGADGLLYVQATGTSTPGQVADAGGNLFVQKSGAPGAREVADASGWLYEQATDASGRYIYDSTDPLDTTPGTQWHYDAANGLWYENGAGTGITTADMLAAGYDMDANFEKVQGDPIRTSKGIPSTTPVRQFDANGNPVEATQTFNFYGMGTKSELQRTTSTSFAGTDGRNNFFERFSSQDGYTYGELRSITVSQDGVLSGQYSNGVTLELYQLTLYDFPSTQNLRREGGNLFSETRESGLHTTGAPGSGGFGTTESNSLEQSNVDLAREFVQMITTQRGFQANSKSVTTVDTMLDTVINMKR